MIFEVELWHNLISGNLDRRNKNINSKAYQGYAFQLYLLLGLV